MPTAQTAQSGVAAWGQLIGSVGQVIPQPIAKQLIAQAWRTVCRARNWSFLRAEGYLIAPAAIEGTVSFTRGSNSATANAALQALIETPAIDRLVDIGKMAIRDTETTIYQIRGYSAGGTITLDKPYLGLTGDRAITIFRQYFTPPITGVSEAGENVESGNFRSWISITDPLSTCHWLSHNRTAQWIDLIDPARTQTGEPSHIVQAPYDVLGRQTAVTGTPLFELWPHYVGSEGKIYQCKFYRDYIPLSDDPGDLANILPIAIPLSYLLAQAKVTAYEWAEANKGDYPKLLKPNWIQLLQVAMAKAESEYLDAQRVDEERYPENIDDRPHRRGFGWGYNQNTGPGLGWPFGY